MKRKTRVFIKILFAFVGVMVVAAVAYYGAVQVLAAKQHRQDKTEQLKRFEAYLLDKGAPVDEQSFAAFDIASNNPKINEIQTLNTHNSYKKNISPPIYAFNSLIVGKKALVSSYYEHDTLIGQLNSGIRGFELDIRYEEGKFGLYHVPGTDKSSTSPDWEIALKELAQWSEHNPMHIPITVLVEYKNDSPLWNYKAEKADIAVLEKLDNSVKDIIGRENLYTPADLKAGYPDIKSAVSANAWQTVTEARGKFIFIFHPHDEYTEIYINRDKSLNTQVFFPMIDYLDVDKYIDYTAYVLCNEPRTHIIQGFTAANFIVRTRMDEGMKYDPKRRELALTSGAQLVTTDFEYGIKAPKSDYVAYLEGEFTIRLRPDLIKP